VATGEFQEGSWKGCLIILLVILAAVGLMYFFYTKMMAVQKRGKAVADAVVAPYLQLIATGKFAEAYQTSLSPEYRQNTPIERFTQAHQEHVQKYGTLKTWEHTRTEELHELVGKKSYFRFQYFLHFERQRDLVAVYEVLKSGAEYRIDATYSKAIETLNSEIW
jgi:hypothetical protein